MVKKPKVMKWVSTNGQHCGWVNSIRDQEMTPAVLMFPAMSFLGSRVWPRKNSGPRNNSEPRTLAQEEVYLACKVKVHLKIRFEWAAQRAALAF